MFNKVPGTEVSYLNAEDGSKKYFFPQGIITAHRKETDEDNSYMSYKTPDMPNAVSKYWKDITDKQGTTNIFEYVDYLAVNGYFFNRAPASVGQVEVTQANFRTVLSNIDPKKSYRIAEEIHLEGFKIVIPGNVSFTGYDFDRSKLIAENPSDIILESAPGGSGNILIRDIAFEVGHVWNLTGITGFEAIELARVNFNNVSSRGNIINYRQGLGNGNGYFGGTPELNLSGTWNGWRETVCIARGLQNIISFWKAGTNFLMSGRFITDMNIDLPTQGAFIDFDESHILNDEGLQIKGATVTRNGVLDSSDVSIHPNIDETSVKSFWSGNTGVPNTIKTATCKAQAEQATSILVQNTYYPIEASWIIDKESHFDSPTPGVLRLLSGSGKYKFFGNLTLRGGRNDVIQIKVVKSQDNFVTSEELETIPRVINNLAGSRDIAFVPLTFIGELKKNDLIRTEVLIVDDTGTITAEAGSYYGVFQ